MARGLFSHLWFLDVGRNGLGDVGFVPLIEELKAGLELPTLKEVRDPPQPRASRGM
jgi:hypothetical protein